MTQRGMRSHLRRRAAPVAALCSLVATVGFAAAPAVASAASLQTLTSGFLPYGVAIDSAGDVFAADFTNNRVIKLSTGGALTTLPFTGLNGPAGVALDQNGDVFVADSGNNRVLELPAGSTAQTVLPFTGLSQPTGLAFERDSAFTSPGYLYVADRGNDRVVRMLIGFGQEAVPFTGLNRPEAVAVDGSFDVFVSDDNNQVYELPGVARRRSRCRSADSSSRARLRSIGRVMCSSRTPVTTGSWSWRPAPLPRRRRRSAG